MFDYIDFTSIDGSNNQRALTLFSLNTCGFCKRARAYLDSLNCTYNIFQVDSLDVETKSKLKKDFKDQFGQTLHFPTLIIDEKELLVGFIRPSWEMVLENKE